MKLYGSNQHTVRIEVFSQIPNQRVLNYRRVYFRPSTRDASRQIRPFFFLMYCDQIFGLVVAFFEGLVVCLSFGFLHYLVLCVHERWELTLLLWKVRFSIF